MRSPFISDSPAGHKALKLTGFEYPAQYEIVCCVVKFDIDYVRAKYVWKDADGELQVCEYTRRTDWQKDNTILTQLGISTKELVSCKIEWARYEIVKADCVYYCTYSDENIQKD